MGKSSTNRWLWFIGAWIGAFWVLPSQSFDLSVSTPKVFAQPSVSQLSLEQLKQIARSITVKIISGDSKGSGILIRKEGQVYTVLTNHHVLSPNKPSFIQTPDGHLYRADLVTGVNFHGNDLALFKFRANADYAVASLARENLSTAIIKESVIAAGFPFNATPSPSDGLNLSTGQIFMILEQSLKEGYQIAYSNDIEKGMSGGPILNSQGQVIGIHGIHAYPLWGDPYVYEDGSHPPETLRSVMNRYSWGIPIQKFTQLAPQYVSQDAVLETALPPPEKALPPIVNEVNNIAKEITVLIEWPNGNGSGVIVAKQGNTYHVLTAEHVVRDKKQIEIVTPDGERHPVTVNENNVKPISGVDLAVLEFTSNKNYRVGTLADYELMDVLLGGGNNLVFVSGLARDSASSGVPKHLLRAGKLVEGQLAGSFFSTNENSLSYGYELIYTNLTEAGMSGGPVLDIQGRVIGLHGRTEVDEIKDRSGKDRQIQIGFSWGIPIRTFLSRASESGIERELQVETSPPQRLTKEQSDLITEALFSSNKPSGSNDPIDWINYGWQNMRSGNPQKHEEAIAAFDQAIKINPDLHQAWYLRGFALLFQINDFQGIMSQRGKFYQEDSQKLKSALDSFDRAIKINPKFQPTWRFRSLALTFSGQFYEALKSSNKAIELNPDDLGAKLIQLAMLSYRRPSSDISEITNQWTEGNRSTSDPLIQSMRAMLRSQKQPTEVLAELTEAIRLNPDSATIYITRGNVYDRLGNYQKAIADYSEAIRLNPDLSQPYINRGNSRSSLEDYAEAVTDYTQVIRLAPKNPSAYFQRGVTYHQLQNYQQAIADFDEAIRLNPDFAAAYGYRGLSRAGLKNKSGAVEDLQRAAQLFRLANNSVAYQKVQTKLRQLQDTNLDYKAIASFPPKAAREHFQRGLDRDSAEDYTGAIASFTEAIRLDPTDPDFYYHRGITYHRLGNYQQAIADFDEASRLNPDFAEAYGDRGLSRAGLKDKSGAVEDLQRAAQLFRLQNNLVAYQYVQNKLRQIQDATGDYEAIIRLPSPKANEHFQRGISRIVAEDYLEAIASFTEVIRLDPSDPSAYFQRGRIHRRLGNYQQAIADFDEAIRFNPDYALAYASRGLSRASIGDRSGAIEDSQRAAQLFRLRNNTLDYQIIQIQLRELQKENQNYDPTKSSVEYLIRGFDRTDLTDYQGAIDNFTKAIRLDPKNPLFYYYRGQTYRRLQDYQKAIADFDEAIHLNPDFAEAYGYRGLSRAGLGDKSKAIEDLEKAGQLFQEQNNINAYQTVQAQIKQILEESSSEERSD